MTNPKDPQADIREAIQMWVELAVHKFHAADGVVIMGDCSQESVDEITKLFQAHQQQLLSELLGELPKKYPEPTQAPDGSIIDEYKLAFNIAIDEVVSVIQSKIGELNG